jgi:hypothetical protein
MAKFRYNYSPGNPPAPGVLLDLTSPLSGVEVRDVPALLDSGADLTVIPLRLVQALQVPQLDLIPIQGYDELPTPMPTFSIRLQVRDFPPVDVEAVGADVKDAILGRDVFNHYFVLLNGPRLSLELWDVQPTVTPPP